MTFHPVGATIGNIAPPLPIADGGTNAITAPAALANLGGAPLSDTGWGPTDQGSLLAWNYDGPASTSGGSTPLTPAGTVFTMAIKIPVALSVTNIVMHLFTNGGTLTSGQCFAALYGSAASAPIGVTAEQHTLWSAGAPKLVTMALVGGPFPVPAGVAYVAVWYNGTTGPAFYRTASTSTLFNAGLADAASRWGTSSTGVTTTAPNPLGTITATGSLAGYWVALS